MLLLFLRSACAARPLSRFHHAFLLRVFPVSSSSSRCLPFRQAFQFRFRVRRRFLRSGEAGDMFDQRLAHGARMSEAWGAGHIYHYGHDHSNASSPAKAVEIEKPGTEDPEMKDLGELLAAFPGLSLSVIAQAYTEADSDVNAAAELLATRHPTVKSNGVQDFGRNLTAEKNNGIRKSAQQSVVGSDDLLMEKYGKRVGEIINREPTKQSNSLLHNMRPAHGGASSYPNRLLNPEHDRVGSCGVKLINKEHSNEVSSDGVVLHERKKTKQKGRGGLENGVEQASTTASRQAELEFLVSRLGESFPLDIVVIRDVLDNFNGDTQKGFKVLQEMALSTSPQSQKINSTNSQDRWYFDDKEMDGRVTKAHFHNAPMQNFMEHQRFRDDFCNEPNMVPRGGSTANGSTCLKSKTDPDPLEILHSLKQIFPHLDDEYLFEVLQSCNFKLGDAAQFLLDATAHESFTHYPAGSKVNHGSRSNVSKTNVHKDSGDSLVSTKPAPLRALWADTKPKITPLKHDLDNVSLKRGVPGKTSEGDFDEYGRQRKPAHEHWRLMNYYFKEAVAAYNRGERSRSVALSEKGEEQKLQAQRADERASQRIFESKNKDIVNNITIDLHAQHVREAMNVLKRHLQTLCSIPSVHMLTVITGYGSHSSNGRARIKPAVTAYLSRNGIDWDQVNEGCLTIKMKNVRNKELHISDGE